MKRRRGVFNRQSPTVSIPFISLTWVTVLIGSFYGRLQFFGPKETPSILVKCSMSSDTCFVFDKVLGRYTWSTLKESVFNLKLNIQLFTGVFRVVNFQLVRGDFDVYVGTSLEGPFIP